MQHDLLPICSCLSICQGHVFKMKRGVTTMKSAEGVESALHTSPSLNEISSVTKPRTIVVDEVEG